MSTIDKAALIEQAAEAVVDALVMTPLSDTFGTRMGPVEHAGRAVATAALPVIAKALLTPLRELHRPAQIPRFDYCVACTQANERDPMAQTWVLWPCATVRLLDAIEAEVQP